MLEDSATLLDDLTPDRRSHSLAVAARAASVAIQHVPPGRLADLITAATLHDIGYAARWATTGFHPLDGANALAKLGYSRLVCHLVATHTGARLEARTRQIDCAQFDLHQYSAHAGIEESILAWADLTTGPQGQSVTVEQRIAEILHRYPPESPVSQHIKSSVKWLHAAGSEPLGAHTQEQHA